LRFSNGPLTDDEIGNRIQKMIAFERSFWRDRKFRYYLVTVSTFGRDYGVSGGGGFANAFALFLPPRSTLGYGDQSLLAHGIFPTWNPYRMVQVPESSAAMFWFTEASPPTIRIFCRSAPACSPSQNTSPKSANKFANPY